jgi:alkyl sulfatase BDS1-like metallo-beta-lactamase superfamily hydrolase
MNRTTLDSLILGELDWDEAIASGEVEAECPVEVECREDALQELMALLDEFEFWFNIVTP